MNVQTVEACGVTASEDLWRDEMPDSLRDELKVIVEKLSAMDLDECDISEECNYCGANHDFITKKEFVEAILAAIKKRLPEPIDPSIKSYGHDRVQMNHGWNNYQKKVMDILDAK